MNNSEKVDLVNHIIAQYGLSLCPYCNGILDKRVNKKGKKIDVCDICELIIRTVDYIECITGIIKYSNRIISKINFKKLSEF